MREIDKRYYKINIAGTEHIFTNVYRESVTIIRHTKQTKTASPVNFFTDCRRRKLTEP